MGELKPSMLGRIDTPYWQGLAEGELRFPQCAGCNAWTWPVQLRCRACGRRDLTWRAVAPEGRVYSWTRTHLPFIPALARLLPYTVLVELPQAGGIRILGMFTGDEAQLRIGAALTGQLANPSEETMGLHVMRWDLAVSARETAS